MGAAVFRESRLANQPILPSSFPAERNQAGLRHAHLLFTQQAEEAKRKEEEIKRQEARN